MNIISNRFKLKLNNCMYIIFWATIFLEGDGNIAK